MVKLNRKAVVGPILPKITCEYCSHFQKHYVKEGEQYCHKGRPAKTGQQACLDFDLYEFFWCDKDENRLDFCVCISRQNKQKEGCVHCKQGKKIMAYQKTREDVINNEENEKR